jgi:uncharacterized membrane protein YeaQ/YmgE (transglycosylase-associated protein family)
MTLLFWVILGVLAGSIAKVVAWDDEPGGWAPILLLSTIGAIVGGFAGTKIWSNSDFGGFDPGCILLALLAAAVMVWPYGAVVKQRRAKVQVEHRRAA